MVLPPGGSATWSVAMTELLSALLAMPDPRRVRVWREGMTDWAEAGSVPEVASKLPPAGPSVPSASGTAPAVTVQAAEAVAKLYRRLVLLVGLQLLIGCLIRTPEATGPSEIATVLALIGLVGAVVVLALLITTAYRLMSLLGADGPALWAIAMFVPCINVFVLLAISSRAQEWCKRYGIKVGFFGPTQESLEELRRKGT